MKRIQAEFAVRHEALLAKFKNLVKVVSIFALSTVCSHSTWIDSLIIVGTCTPVLVAIKIRQLKPLLAICAIGHIDTSFTVFRTAVNPRYTLFAEVLIAA